jgi:nitroreductase
MANEVLKAIRERRSVLRFAEEPVPEDKLELILEAGRWAPSYANSQPWKFIVVRDPEKKRKLGELVERIVLGSRGRVAVSGRGLGDPPLVIVVVVDPLRDPRHFLEAGAVATQNMALAAHSLGLASYWAGVYELGGGRHSVERQVKKILAIPRELRVVALLPIGVPAYQADSERVELASLVAQDQYPEKA